MGTDIQGGVVFVDGNLYHDSDFNAATNDATILSTAISSKTLKDPLSAGDEFLISDAGVLKKITGQQIIALLTLPPGVMMDYGGATEPLGWIFCYGQAISRTTYSALFTAIGTAYGAGDGSNTFNVPDCRGRVTAGDDNMGGTAAGRLTTAVAGFDGSVRGASGGAQSHTLTAAEMPVHNHVVPEHAHAYQAVIEGEGIASGVDWGFGAVSTSIQGAFGTTNAGSGGAHRNVQPTIIVSKIIKT